jgi:hypothetical protein
VVWRVMRGEQGGLQNCRVEFLPITIVYFHPCKPVIFQEAQTYNPYQIT